MAIDDIDTDIIQGFMNSYTKNIQFSNLVANTFNRFYLQNVKYHLLWLFIHSFAYAYNPINDSQKLQVANFIYYTIPKFLTDFCSSCSSDYSTYIVGQDIMNAVQDRTRLSNFFLELHNHISRVNFDSNIIDDIYRPAFIIDVNSTKLYANTPPTPPTTYTFQDLTNKYGGSIDYNAKLYTKFRISMNQLLNDSNLIGAKLADFYEEFNAINLTTDIDANFKVDIKVSY